MRDYVTAIAQGGAKDGMAAHPPIETPAKADKIEARLDDMVLVVLHNDDANTMEHVVECLVMVFGHSLDLAVKIMLEAHELGRATAAVEAETPARLHRDQLRSLGLVATIEAIE